MMSSLLKSALIVVMILILEFAIYSMLIEPKIIEWGASEQEFVMEMAGDNNLHEIMSTRAITINAPTDVVWRWLMQLGADRAGFYSYEFIELALGYETRYPKMLAPRFDDLQQGDLVRGSIDTTRGVIPYNFKVLNVVSENTFVLENWGSFLITPIGNGVTRLVIRTQEIKNDVTFDFFKQYLAVPFHFIMERRTLYGIKMKAESTNALDYSHAKDKVWFFSVLLSWCLIVPLALIIRGFNRRITIPTTLGAAWLIVLFLFPPLPLYSVTFLAITCVVYLFLFKPRWWVLKSPALWLHLK